MKKAGLPAAETYSTLHLVFGGMLLGAVAIYALAPPKPR
jgi:hypothetical protein